MGELYPFDKTWKSEVSTVSGMEISALIQTGELVKGAAAEKERDPAEGSVTEAEAPEEQQTEASEENNNNNRRISLIKFAAFAVLAAAIVVFATIAWFASNRETATNGMAVKAGTTSLRLATRESYVSYEDVLKAADSSYNTGSSVTLPDKNGDEDTYYMLSAGDSLILQCKDQSGEDEAAHGNKDIQPSDWDKLELYIVPDENGDLSADISLEVIPFATIEVYEDDGVTPVYVKDEQGEDLIVDGKRIRKTENVRLTTRAEFVSKAQELNNTQAENEADEYMAAADHVKGHIMFFGGLNEFDEDDPTSFYFTDPYTDGTFTFSETGVEKDTAYEVPIYWMWPNTLGQIALPDSDGRKGIPIISDSAAAEKAAMITYLKTNKNQVFANLSSIYEGASDSDIDAAIDSIADPEAASLDTVNFKKLSDGYNKADFRIGYYISYFAIEIDVRKQG